MLDGRAVVAPHHDPFQVEASFGCKWPESSLTGATGDPRGEARAPAGYTRPYTLNCDEPAIVGHVASVARSIAALRESSDAELIREHHEIAPHTILSTDFYIQELFRRSAERAGEKAQDLAVKVYRLKIASTCLSVIAVFAAVIALCRWATKRAGPDQPSSRR